MLDCTNPGLFSAGPDWLEPGEPRRHEALWQFARGKAEGEGGALRRHVEECRACSRLVQSFRRLDGAARGGAGIFAVCPSAKDLLDYSVYELPVDPRQKVDAHLPACPFCREDLAWLARTAESKVIAINRRRWLAYGAVAAALALLALIPLLRRPSPYAGLAQIPAINRTDLMATLREPQKFGSLLEESLDAYEGADYRMAEAKARIILEVIPADPSALFVAAMAEYRQGHSAEAEKLMDESERTQPMTEFRCWTALQLGMATGSRARIDRECRHLENAPAYAPQVRRIRQTVRQRG